MEPPIWNKPPIWNTFAADRVIFRIGVFTVLLCEMQGWTSKAIPKTFFNTKSESQTIQIHSESTKKHNRSTKHFKGLSFSLMYDRLLVVCCK